jgi:tetratricopeptide (TPR) repeat protein
MRSAKRLDFLLAGGAAAIFGALAAAYLTSPAMRRHRLEQLPLATLERLAEERPRDPLVLDALGLRLGREGRTPQAAKAYRAAVLADPADRVAWIGWASASMALGERDGARNIYSEALRRWPADPEIRFGLAAIASDGQNWPEAAEHLRVGLRAQPKRRQAWEALGQACEQQRDWNGAVDATRRLVEIDTENQHYQAELGRRLMESGRFAEALPVLEGAVRTNPADSNARYNLARALLGRDRPGDQDRAMVELGRVVAFSPGYTAAYYELGNVWRQRKGWADAAQAFARAVDLQPYYLDAYRGLAESYEQLGDAARSARFRRRYEELLQLQAREGRVYNQVVARPGDADAWLDWARLQMDLGHYPQAADAFHKALDRRPGDPAAAQGIQQAETRTQADLARRNQLLQTPHSAVN